MRLLTTPPTPVVLTLWTAAVLTAFVCSAGTAPAQIHVDLRSETPPSARLMQPPGFRVNNLDSKLPLPVEVTLQDPYPAAIDPSGHITALIVVRNISKEPIAIPVSRDFAAIRAADGDRQLLNLDITVTPPEPFKPVFLSGGLLGGSTTVQGSLVTLAPQETVEFQVQSSLTETSNWHGAGLDTAKVTVGAELIEDGLDSSEFTVNKMSEKIKSVNALEVFWHY